MAAFRPFWGVSDVACMFIVEKCFEESDATVFTMVTIVSLKSRVVH